MSCCDHCHTIKMPPTPNGSPDGAEPIGTSGRSLPVVGQVSQSQGQANRGMAPLQVGSFVAHASWVTALSWAIAGDVVLLATGCAEGSVRLHAASAAALSALPGVMADLSAAPADRVMRLVRGVAAPDLRQVSCLALRATICSSAGDPPAFLGTPETRALPSYA